MQLRKALGFTCMGLSYLHGPFECEGVAWDYHAPRYCMGFPNCESTVMGLPRRRETSAGDRGAFFTSTFVDPLAFFMCPVFGTPSPLETIRVIAQHDTVATQ